MLGLWENGRGRPPPHGGVRGRPCARPRLLPARVQGVAGRVYTELSTVLPVLKRRRRHNDDPHGVLGPQTRVDHPLGELGLAGPSRATVDDGGAGQQARWHHRVSMLVAPEQVVTACLKAGREQSCTPFRDGYRGLTQKGVQGFHGPPIWEVARSATEAGVEDLSVGGRRGQPGLGGRAHAAPPPASLPSAGPDAVSGSVSGFGRPPTSGDVKPSSGICQ